MEFRILGPIEVVHDDHAVVLGGMSMRALLAVLLLNVNEVVSRDRLLDELWDGETPGSGATALQVRVSQLRKALGAAASRLETRSPGYLLRVEPGELDLDRFTSLLGEAADEEPEAAAEKLRAALALWRGPALGDLTYESFAQAAILRMEELRLLTIERRIEADLALGRHDELIPELEALVSEHPLRERVREQLMLSLYRAGRQADALAAYQAARRTFVDELGIEPSQPLQQLESAILRHDPGLELVSSEELDRAILVAAFDDDRLETLLELAAALSRRPPKELILAHVVGDADGLHDAASALGEHRANLLGVGVAARGAAFVSPAPAADLIRLAVEQDVELLLLGGGPDLFADAAIAGVLSAAPCDVAVLVGAGRREGPILVPFVGAEHDWAAIELGAWAAGALGESLRLAGPRHGSDTRDASRLLASASLAVQRTLGVAAEPLLVGPGPDALLAAADDAGLVVVGLSDRWRSEGLGGSRAALAASSRVAVVIVRRGLRPGGLAPREAMTRFTWTLRG